EYRVVNAQNDEDARQMVRTVSNYNLVKTAIFGSDPNWGRIIAAAGRAVVAFDPERVDLYIGSDRNKRVQILNQGQHVNERRSQLKKEMEASTITIIIDLNAGTGKGIGWGSDFSYEYVRINAEYTT